MRNGIPARFWLWRLRCFRPASASASAVRKTSCWSTWRRSWERKFRVFSLDTGRLHPETLRFLDQVRERYQIPIEVFFPRPEAVEKLVGEKGLFSFYKDGHQECCGVRKVEPLRRALSTLSAWVTGQRRDQSPSTRAAVPVVQADPTFSTPDQ